MTKTTMNISKTLAKKIDIALDFFENDIVATGIFDDLDTGIEAIRSNFLKKGPAEAKEILYAVFMAAPLDAAGGIVIPNRDDVIAMLKPARRAIKKRNMFIHVVDFDREYWPSTDKIADGWYGHPVTSIKITH